MYVLVVWCSNQDGVLAEQYRLLKRGGDIENIFFMPRTDFLLSRNSDNLKP